MLHRFFAAAGHGLDGAYAASTAVDNDHEIVATSKTGILPIMHVLSLRKEVAVRIPITRQATAPSEARDGHAYMAAEEVAVSNRTDVLGEIPMYVMGAK